MHNIHSTKDIKDQPLNILLPASS